MNNHTQTDVQHQDMTDEVFDILRSAVSIARDRQVRTLSALRALLAIEYPGKEAACDAAIKAWGNYVRTAHPNGVTRT